MPENRTREEKRPQTACLSATCRDNEQDLHDIEYRATKEFKNHARNNQSSAAKRCNIGI